MSLARFALRFAAVEALRGVTMVGDNVRDSDFGALDIGADGSLRTDEDRPFILVYTDDGAATEVAQRSLMQNGSVEFVIEIGIASAMVLTDPDTGESTIPTIGIPATDSAMELALDLIDRQVAVALTGAGDWAEIWKGVSRNAMKVERRRATHAEDGTRLAARQIRMTLDVMRDPVMDAPIAEGSIWDRFRSALDAVRPDLTPVVAAMLGTAETEMTIGQIAALRGDTITEARFIGYGWEYGAPGTITDPRLDECIG